MEQLNRLDNDVPAQLLEEQGGRVRVLFEGHDGVFLLNSAHPDFARIHAQLTAALRQKTRVWFTAKPDLGLLDVGKIRPA